MEQNRLRDGDTVYVPVDEPVDGECTGCAFPVGARLCCSVYCNASRDDGRAVIWVKQTTDQVEPLCCPWCGADDVVFENSHVVTDLNGKQLDLDQYGCKACNKEFFL